MSDDLEEEHSEQENPNIRQLREKAKKAEEAERRAVEAERKLAFAEAGINMSDPKSRYFIAGYDGDLSADAIRAAAERDGFLGNPTEPVETPVPVEEAQTIERISQTTETASAPELPSQEDELQQWAREHIDTMPLEEFSMGMARLLQKQGKVVRVDGQELVT